VGLVEDNVGGLVKSSERALQQEEELNHLQAPHGMEA
jgi:hypothetical protein